ncbi:hypothetical protein YSY22_57480 [Brevibacillus formosus]
MIFYTRAFVEDEDYYQGKRGGDYPSLFLFSLGLHLVTQVYTSGVFSEQKNIR